MPRNTAQLSYQLPFYWYLYDFYSHNKTKIKSTYTPLTRKFLHFNDPDAGTSFLRRPQFEALEIYVFLKEYYNNEFVAKIFEDWHKRKGGFAGREGIALRIGELGLFEDVDAKIYEASFKRMQQYRNIYLCVDDGPRKNDPHGDVYFLRVPARV